MGANVIKIEAPTGDPNRQIGVTTEPDMGALFVTMNRNKRSVVLNLKRHDAREALLRLVDGADVFVHSMRERAAKRLGIDYAAIAARNPRIVYAFARGYRHDGPMHDRPAYDDVIQDQGGLAGLSAQIDGTPRYVPMAMADKLCGYVLSSAISTALFERERTGLGQQVQVPMLETVLSLALIGHLWFAALDGAQGTIGYPRLFSPGRRPFATKDGHICLMANTDEQWHRLLAAVGRPELAQDPCYRLMAQRSLHYDETLSDPRRTTGPLHHDGVRTDAGRRRHSERTCTAAR